MATTSFDRVAGAPRCPVSLPPATPSPDELVFVVGQLSWFRWGEGEADSPTLEIGRGGTTTVSELRAFGSFVESLPPPPAAANVGRSSTWRSLDGGGVRSHTPGLVSDATRRPRTLRGWRSYSTSKRYTCGPLAADRPTL